MTILTQQESTVRKGGKKISDTRALELVGCGDIRVQKKDVAKEPVDFEHSKTHSELGGGDARL